MEYRIRIGFRQIRKTFLHNPPVKNQRFLTAPFTQGGLGCGTQLKDKLKLEFPKNEIYQYYILLFPK